MNVFSWAEHLRVYRAAVVSFRPLTSSLLVFLVELFSSLPVTGPSSCRHRGCGNFPSVRPDERALRNRIYVDRTVTDRAPSLALPTLRVNIFPPRMRVEPSFRLPDDVIIAGRAAFTLSDDVVSCRLVRRPSDDAANNRTACQ